MASTQPEVPLEADSTTLDNSEHSDYASSGYDTSTTSLSSTVNKYIFENGRRYHAYFGLDKNVMPTDEKEQDRLDLHHEIMLKSLDDKILLAPLENPQRILDIGTGTGIWAIDAADLYPSAEVTGTDISPIQPTWVPPNCKFVVDDAERDFINPNDHFDFVHARNLAQSIQNWPKLVSEVYRTVKPGGYFELADLGGEIFCDDGSSTQETNGYMYNVHLVSEALTSIGRPPAKLENMRSLLEAAGFVDIHTRSIKQPVGPWPKDQRQKQIGAMNLLSMETGIEAYSLATLTRIKGMSKEEVARICRDSWNAVKNKNFHVYGYFFVVYGRKPETV